MSNQLMSDQIDQLATALAKAQGEFDTAGKNQKNPFFKSNYADFEAVVEASRPALSKYGLSVFQSPFFYADMGECLVTVLLHSSGQWVKSIEPYKPAKSDVQALSSYNTYLKRMCYTSLLGVITGENDDDGDRATIRSNEVQSSPQPIREVVSYVNAEQEQQLRERLHGYPVSADKVLKNAGVTDLKYIRADKFFANIKWIDSLILGEKKSE